MKKILIIGAKGMLGQELCKQFSADRNYEVIGYDIENINIAREDEVREKILPLAPQIIINAAAYNNVDKCEEPAEFDKAKEVNGMAPGYLAAVAKELDAVFVHFSSDYVFSGENKKGYKEDSAPSPVSNYGWTKFLGEKQVQKKGQKFYIIRLQKLFGQPSSTPGAKKSFFYNLMTLAKDKKEFEMVDDELSDFTYAPDLAAQTKYLIESPSISSGQDFPFGIYHITNEGLPVTWFGAAKALFMILDQPDIKFIPVSAEKFVRPAKRPKYSILINTKLPPLRPWPKALKEFLNR
jgi:dTDP-4-dehydrorhamnose reductase